MTIFPSGTCGRGSGGSPRGVGVAGAPTIGLFGPTDPAKAPPGSIRKAPCVEVGIHGHIVAKALGRSEQADEADVARAVHHAHAAAAELALDVIAVGEGGSKVG